MNELHRCHRAVRCTNRETDPDQPDLKRGAPINPAEGLCDTCTSHLHHALAELPRDYAALETAITGTTDTLRQPVAGTPEPPAPISLTVAATQTDLLHEAMCWAESVADVLHADWDTQAARDSRPGPVLHRASRLLTGALTAFLALRDVLHTGWVYGTWTTTYRDGLDGAETFLNLHQRARALTGQRRHINHLPVPCPHCQRTALTRDDGDETIECAACTTRMSWDEYQRSCTLLARDHRITA